MANESNIKDELKGLFKEHDYNQLYYKQDIVTYQINGTTNFYQAIRNVPRYVPITDRTYWNQLNVTEGSSEGNTPVDDVDYFCISSNEGDCDIYLIGITNVDENFELIQLDNNDDNNGGTGRSLRSTRRVDDPDPDPDPVVFEHSPFNLEYSTDKINWTKLTLYYYLTGERVIDFFSDLIHFENPGDKVYFRGNNIKGTYYYSEENEYNYEVNFVESNSDDSKTFSVTGDLQTLVSSDGTDKENGCFYDFLSKHNSITITTAPDLTATSFVDHKYFHLFAEQHLLTKPANIYTDFSLEDLNGLDRVFNYMYGESGITEPMNLNNITIATNADYSLFLDNFSYIYGATSFNITDDSHTINGFSGITTPDSESAFTLCSELGNINGFDTADVYIITQNTVIENPLYTGESPINDLLFSKFSTLKSSDEEYTMVTIEAAPANNNYEFEKWQETTDGGITWTDVDNGTTATITIPVYDTPRYLRAIVTQR